jgi:hypothetical protein
MRLVDIKFSKRNSTPGDIISGVVIVETDSNFECNGVILKVKGKERTEIGSGDSKITDEHIHLRGNITLSEATEIRTGKTEFPFKFRLDEGLPPTYSGYYGWIEYSIQAVVELDWRLDQTITRRFRVLPFQPDFIPEIDGYNPLNKDKEMLHVELRSDVLRMKEGIPVRFMVDEHSRVNGIRLEIRRREYAKCRSRERTYDVTITSKFIPISFRDFHRWLEEVVGKGWRRVPIQSNLLRTSYYLKAVVEVRWGLDPYVIYGLNISGEKPQEEVVDVFEDLVFDLGFD